MSLAADGTARLVCRLAACLGFVASALGVCAEEVPLSLAEALDLAQRQNPEILAQRARTDAELARAEEVKKTGWPRLALASGWSWTNNPSLVFAQKLNAGEFTQEDFAIDRLNAPDGLSHLTTTAGRRGADRRSSARSGAQAERQSAGGRRADAVARREPPRTCGSASSKPTAGPPSPQRAWRSRSAPSRARALARPTWRRASPRARRSADLLRARARRREREADLAERRGRAQIALAALSRVLGAEPRRLVPAQELPPRRRPLEGDEAAWARGPLTREPSCRTRASASRRRRWAERAEERSVRPDLGACGQLQDDRNASRAAASPAPSGCAALERVRPRARQACGRGAAEERAAEQRRGRPRPRFGSRSRRPGGGPGGARALRRRGRRRRGGPRGAAGGPGAAAGRHGDPHRRAGDRSGQPGRRARGDPGRGRGGARRRRPAPRRGRAVMRTRGDARSRVRRRRWPSLPAAAAVGRGELRARRPARRAAARRSRTAARGRSGGGGARPCRPRCRRGSARRWPRASPPRWSSCPPRGRPRGRGRGAWCASTTRRCARPGGRGGRGRRPRPTCARIGVAAREGRRHAARGGGEPRTGGGRGRGRRGSPRQPGLRGAARAVRGHGASPPGERGRRGLAGRDADRDRRRAAASSCAPPSRRSLARAAPGPRRSRRSWTASPGPSRATVRSVSAAGRPGHAPLRGAGRPARRAGPALGPLRAPARSRRRSASAAPPGARRARCFPRGGLTGVFVVAGRHGAAALDRGRRAGGRSRPRSARASRRASAWRSTPRASRTARRSSGTERRDARRVRRADRPRLPRQQAHAAADRGVARPGRARAARHAARGGAADPRPDGRRDRGLARRGAGRGRVARRRARSSGRCGASPASSTSTPTARPGFALVTVRFRVNESNEESLVKVYERLVRRRARSCRRARCRRRSSCTRSTTCRS